MNNWQKRQDILRERYSNDEALRKAKEVLQRDEQTEEAFLGAQGVLILHGLI